MSSKLPPQKMAETSKDELLLGRGIRHLTATSQDQARSKPNIVNRPEELLVRLCAIIIVHNTVTQRETILLFQYSPPRDQHHISDVAKWR